MTFGGIDWQIFVGKNFKTVLVQVATIYSAVKLEQEQQFLVAKKLQELTGSKNIKLKTVIDESLIAGFSVDFGSAQIDLSVKGQLEDVASDLVSGSASLDLSGSKKSTVSHHLSLSLQRPVSSAAFKCVHLVPTFT